MVDDDKMMTIVNVIPAKHELIGSGTVSSMLILVCSFDTQLFISKDASMCVYLKCYYS